MNDPQKSAPDKTDAFADAANLLDESKEFWSCFAGRELTREDARQIRENLTGFFGLLRQWDAADEPEKSHAPESVEFKRAA